ncbi:hypothetical protein NIES2100_21740 [Calothrix sp. NIES-2100]|uniref:DUF928 domain-containing protein n=1 Tax=Calothrix sp. NIES-2100 TaxID=1954172 RepID=UPI000B5E3BA8|nr:hypothetical protein NIES2100_21740 [Calothrix sp. NIES-2100]
MTNYYQKISLTVVLNMTLLGSVIYCPALWALPVTLNNAPIKFIPPPPPPDRGAAGDRGGAASRGCGSGNESLMALAPVYEQTLKPEQTAAISVTKVWGLTTAAHSTFWFFVPHQKTAIASMEFVIKDETNKPSQTIYRSAVNPPSNPGIISVALPETTTPLQVGKIYHWFLKVKVNCNPQQPAELTYVEGWVQRVNPNSRLAESLKQAAQEQQVALYAENGIWYDALTAAAKLRLDKPKDASVVADWTSLLKSVGLENLANQPLVN